MALAIRPEGATLIVPALEKDHAVGAVSDVGVVAWSDGQDPHALVHEALTGAERVAVEKDHLTVRQAELLQLRHMSDISGEVRRMRSVKTAGELEKLHRAAAITDHTYEEVVRAIRVGQSELEVANMITAAISGAGGTLSFEPLVQFGHHSAAREVIQRAGHGDHFIHRTGHGLGLEAHEDPSLDPGSHTTLEAGMVCTVEPGIYMQGWGGVRIEDDIVVESHGARLLTQADRSLWVIPG